MGSMIPVKYIGPDAHWCGLLYNTRLHFERGQALPLPTDLALKFLSHKDTFALGDDPVTPQTPEEAAAAALAEAGALKKKEEEQQTETFELFDQIDRMNKAAIVAFGLKYGQTMDKSKTLDVLRADAKSFVDRFGAA